MGPSDAAARHRLAPFVRKAESRHPWNGYGLTEFVRGRTTQPRDIVPAAPRSPSAATREATCPTDRACRARPRAVVPPEPLRGLAAGRPARRPVTALTQDDRRRVAS